MKLLAIKELTEWQCNEHSNNDPFVGAFGQRCWSCNLLKDLYFFSICLILKIVFYLILRVRHTYISTFQGQDSPKYKYSLYLQDEKVGSVSGELLISFIYKGKVQINIIT